MYDGWLVYDGVPIVNADLTKALAEQNGMSWFLGCEGCGTRGVPVTAKQAPWWDAYFADLSLGFAGLVVTSMSPILDSRVTRNVIPLARGGAAMGRRHEQHREMTVAATLIARDRPSAVYGLEWLTNVLQFGGTCGETTRDRTGFDMEVWLWCPDQRPGPHRRFMYEAHVTDGPKVLRERDLNNCEGHIIDVEFTLTIGNPGVYGEQQAFGTLITGAIKDHYADLRDLAPDGTPLPQPRTYIDLENLVQPYPDTTYDELLAAMVAYGTPVTSEAPEVWSDV